MSKKNPAKAQPSQQIRNYTLESHSEDFNEYKDCLESDASIRCELTRDNYQRKFHHLLCWEEREHCRMLEE